MIRIDGLEKRFGKKRILDGFSLTLENQNAWLLGPNGSGKTTLFRIILGLLSSDKGSITAEGKAHGKLDIGYLPQRFGPFPHLTVEEQLQYFARLKMGKQDGINWSAEVDQAIRLVHLEEERKKKCKALSGGMVRRLGIAQAIMGKPDLILLDEPTVGLDIEERLRLQDILDGIRGKQPVLVSTHILDDIQSPSDEIIILCNQNVSFRGSPESLRKVADGLVWIVPETVYSLHQDQLSQISRCEQDGETYVRVLANTPSFSNPSATPAVASVQDGYLYILNEEKMHCVPHN